MIEVKNLYKSFEDKEVLKDINCCFEEGKTNLIIGQSGSGKTVLVKNLVGLLDPTSGEIFYDGRDLVKMSKKEKVMMRREMGMIFQSAALFDSLSVLENVMFPLDMFSTKTYRERVKRAQDCLARVNLDPKTSLVIDQLLSSITKEKNITTIINTHDMNSVMGIGEKIIFIYKGHKEWEGTKDEVMNSTNRKLNDLVFASDLFKKVKEVALEEELNEETDILSPINQ